VATRLEAQAAENATHPTGSDHFMNVRREFADSRGAVAAAGFATAGAAAGAAAAGGRDAAVAAAVVPA
jgi:hypothetical protein